MTASVCSLTKRATTFSCFHATICRKTFPQQYIRVTAFDSTHGTESVVMSFIVNRPSNEPGFRLIRTEEPGRTIRYSVESYAVQARPEGSRY